MPDPSHLVVARVHSAAQRVAASRAAMCVRRWATPLRQGLCRTRDCPVVRREIELGAPPPEPIPLDG